MSFDEKFRRAHRGIEWVAIHLPLIRRLYWMGAPKYYKFLIKPEVSNIELPIDPFELHYVHPERIDRFSGIQGAASDRISTIGSIRSGNWDKSIQALEESLITADRLSSTVLFESMRAHFVDEIPWEETKLVKHISESDDPTDSWNGSHTRDDVLQRCEEIDDLYNRIRNQGYRTQFDLVQNKTGIRSVEKSGFLNALVNEVTVDVGREGTLLLVDGRHRLSIAKILELDVIPVLIVSRHTEWIATLHGDTDQSIPPDHPDRKYCISVPSSDE